MCQSFEGFAGTKLLSLGERVKQKQVLNIIYGII